VQSQIPELYMHECFHHVWSDRFPLLGWVSNDLHSRPTSESEEMNVCETVCVISSGASLEEVDHARVYMYTAVSTCIYVYTKMMGM
jgi:hypothetical protein